jgi:hypothetical protein
MIGLPFDTQVVESVAARKRVSVKEGLGPCGARAEEGGPALPEEIAVVQLVNRVL